MVLNRPVKGLGSIFSRSRLASKTIILYLDVRNCQIVMSEMGYF